MKKLWICGFTACLALYMSSGVFAQVDYEFSIAGPESYTGEAGTEHAGRYTVNLSHTGEAPAAQGWSLGVAIDGGVANDLTLDGTDASMFFSGQFVINGVIDPENNGGQQGLAPR